MGRGHIFSNDHVYCSP